MGVEGGGIGGVEGGALCEAEGKVRVGDEELAEGDGIGFALDEDCFSGGEVEALVGDVGAAEGLLDLRAEAAGTEGLAGGDEGDVAFA